VFRERLSYSSAMKRVTEEALNDNQPVKKAKVDLARTQSLNGHASNVNGWSKVEKKKKQKGAKEGTGKQNVSRCSRVLGSSRIRITLSRSGLRLCSDINHHHGGPRSHHCGGFSPLACLFQAKI
jgi:hypothetical protein